MMTTLVIVGVCGWGMAAVFAYVHGTDVWGAAKARAANKQLADACAVHVTEKQVIESELAVVQKKHNDALALVARQVKAIEETDLENRALRLQVETIQSETQNKIAHMLVLQEESNRRIDELQTRNAENTQHVREAISTLRNVA